MSACCHASSAGARVTITDLGEVLPNIQMNVNANKAEEGQEMNIKVVADLHPQRVTPSSSRSSSR
jgi:hypothetical protein